MSVHTAADRRFGWWGVWFCCVFVLFFLLSPCLPLFKLKFLVKFANLTSWSNFLVGVSSAPSSVRFGCVCGDEGKMGDDAEEVEDPVLIFSDVLEKVGSTLPLFLSSCARGTTRCFNPSHIN
jgi:hypothetical protein